jgi:predicted transcriptional regulator
MNVKSLTAAHLMNKDLATISPAETLRVAARRMAEQRLHCLLIPASEPNRCMGIITAKDIVQILCESETQVLDQLRVADAMTVPAISVQKDFAIIDCVRFMRMSGVRRVLVLDGVKPVGLLSFTDVLRAVARDG